MVLEAGVPGSGGGACGPGQRAAWFENKGKEYPEIFRFMGYCHMKKIV